MIDLSVKKVDISKYVCYRFHSCDSRKIIAINQDGVWKEYDSIIAYVAQLNLATKEARKSRINNIHQACKKAESKTKLYLVSGMYFVWADGAMWKELNKKTK